MTFISRDRPIDPSGSGIESLPPLEGNDPAAWRLDPRDWFAHPERPFELEIGSGKGTFLIQQAGLQPQTNFLGIEWAREFWAYAADRARRHQLENVRLLHADASEFVQYRVPDGICEVVHLYFSDPWPKKRHHKRRIVQPDFLALCADRLAPGGAMHIATDWANYAEHIDEAFAGLIAVPEARVAVAGAMADLAAQRVGQPLASWLTAGTGRQERETVTVHASLGSGPARTIAQDAIRATDAGFRALKLKVGAMAPGDDIARVVAVRAAVGPGVELRLDANGAWDLPTALDTLEAVAAADISFCEEPVAGIGPLAEVGARSAVPVAIDESARSPTDVAAALDTGSIGVVVLKPQALGGPDIALELAALVGRAGGTAVVTSMIDGAVGVAQAAHVAAVIGRETAHGLATSSLLVDDVADPLPVVDGRVSLRPTPGLGVSPN